MDASLAGTPALSEITDPPPAPGEAREIAPGILWLRMPLPFALDHVNLWLLAEPGGYTLVDCGYGDATTRAHWQRHFATTLRERPLLRIVATHCHPDHLGNAAWLAAHFGCSIAMTQAEYLAAHPKVAQVFYPGLPSHPQHALAARQMKGFGGMLSFELGSLERARRFLNRVRLLALAESLGGVESLISHPATMTHASVPPERRAAIGITDGLVRISAGIEDVEDLKADLAQALDAV